VTRPKAGPERRVAETAVYGGERVMHGMDCMMSGWMMGGMGLIGLLLLVLLVLGIAALVKYLVSRRE
jgi:hypothetical protein